ncbi:MAG: uracil-DNA glycosylase [Anaerolineales bacterium]|nr:uracil-DNA glycosylase [Anaerolineales bacterium]
MRIVECIQCQRFPCTDVRHDRYIIPNVDIDPERVSIVLISESAPENSADDYYAPGAPLYARTTLLAFADAGVQANSIQDLLEQGIYFTSAVKCGKTGYGIQAKTIEECSRLLEQEIALFPQVRAFLLMGDVAIKAVNYISKRAGEGRVIPASSTYKIRGPAFYFRGARALPSYLPAGPSFGIKKSKRKMMAEDIAAALADARPQGF